MTLACSGAWKGSAQRRQSRRKLTRGPSSASSRVMASQTPSGSGIRQFSSPSSMPAVTGSFSPAAYQVTWAPLLHSCRPYMISFFSWAIIPPSIKGA